MDFFFYTFCTVENRSEDSTERYKISNFTLSVSSIAAMLFAVRDDSGRPLPAVCSSELIVRSFAKSSNFCFPNFC